MITGNNNRTGQKCPAPFATFAVEYHRLGLSIIPCKQGSKEPLLKSWKQYQQKQVDTKTLESWIKKYPTANIGLLTGSVNKLTVVDIDFAVEDLKEFFSEFGEAMLVSRTPSGGVHLYYQANGERNQSDKTRKIDVRGEGGYVITPPSYNASKKASYEFILGELSQIKQLVPCKATLTAKSPQKEFSESIKKEAGNKILEGERDNKLFLHLKEMALTVESQQELEHMARNYNNEMMQPPLPEAQVLSKVHNIWNMKLEGRLFSKGSQFIKWSRTIHKTLATNPYAAWLLIDLKLCHWNKKFPFPICVKPYAESIGWNEGTFRKALKALIQLGFLKQTHKGGSGKGDTNKYEFKE